MERLNLVDILGLKTNDRPPISGESTFDPIGLLSRYAPLATDVIHEESKLVSGPTDVGHSKVYYCDHEICNMMVKHDWPSVMAEYDNDCHFQYLEFAREIVVSMEISKLNNRGFVKSIGYVTVKNGLYLYQPKIDGVTLQIFIRTCSLEQFKDVMIKLMTRYWEMVEALDFCHYDLHTANVMVVKEGNEYEPVIIDFGSAHIKIPGSNIYLGDHWPELGRYDDKALWVYDMFKIWAFCRMYSDRTYLTELIEKIRVAKCLATRNMKCIKKDINDYATGQCRLIEENQESIDNINNWCLSVLRYFRSDMGELWLRIFRTLDKTWSCHVTKDGHEASFASFLDYVKSI